MKCFILAAYYYKIVYWKKVLLFETDCYDSSVAASYYLTECIFTFSSTYLDS